MMKPRILVPLFGLLLLLTVVFVTGVAEAYWSPPLPIDEGDRAQSLKVLTEPNGNAIVQWRDQGGILGAMQYDIDTGWGPFELLERSDVNPGAHETFLFGMDSSGNIIAVWREWDGKNWWIHTSRMVAGGSWSDPEEIDTGDRGDASVHLSS